MTPCRTSSCGKKTKVQAKRAPDCTESQQCRGCAVKLDALALVKAIAQLEVQVSG